MILANVGLNFLFSPVKTFPFYINILKSIESISTSSIIHCSGSLVYLRLSKQLWLVLEQCEMRPCS